MPLTDMNGPGELVPEPVRRILAGLVMYVGWIGFWAIFVYAITQYNPSQGRFAPQWISFSFFGCLFLALAGTMVRSRMRLHDAIIQAFTLGTQAVREEREAAEKIVMQTLRDVSAQLQEVESKIDGDDDDPRSLLDGT